MRIALKVVSGVTIVIDDYDAWGGCNSGGRIFKGKPDYRFIKNPPANYKKLKKPSPAVSHGITADKAAFADPLCDMIAAVNQTSSVSFHSQLKSAVAEEHARIEKNLFLKNFFSDHFSAAAYVDILKRYYGFIKPLEARIFRFPAWQERKKISGVYEKTGWLETDLKYLDIPAEQVSIALDGDLPDTGSDEASLGCCYVLEGACLGGRQMAKIAAQKFGYLEQSGAAYFNGYNEATSGHWLRFCGLLEDCGRDEPARGGIIAAAKETFRKFDAWLLRGARA